jgi:hypothetical protein
MTLFSRFVIVAMAGMPFLARGEGKCGDDPVPYGPGGKLVVTWAIPYPENSFVRFTGEDVFNEMDRQLGLSSFPAGYPNKYRNPKPVGFFNDTELLTANDTKNWEKRFGIDVPPASLAALDEYVQGTGGVSGKHHIRGALVEHPPVIPAGYSICSCVLQRGVIVYDPASKQEDLYVRSHFSSVKNAQTFESFAPSGGYWFSFTRSRIWFPLRLNKLLKEQAWMVVDVLTPKGRPIPASAIVKPYSAVKRQLVKLFNKDWEAVRVVASFQPGQAAADFELTPP